MRRRPIIIKIFFIFLLFSGIIGPGAGRAEKSNTLVIDAAGRKIQVKKPFSRIISLYGAHTENLFYLGLDPEIIGVTHNEVFPPKALQKPVFSYHDGIEKFLAAKPDLVLIRPMIDRSYPSLIQRMEKSGITIVSLQPSTIDQMYAYWETLGILAGKTQKARSMIRTFQQRVKILGQIADSVKVKKRVYFEAMHHQMRTFSDDSMAIYALETAGGIDVAKDAVPSRGTNIGIYGKEKILSHADDIDVFLVQTGRMNPVSIDTIYNEPGFSVIKAIKNHQIFLIDEMLVSRPTMRLLQGIEKIGKILHPNSAQWEIYEKSGKETF